MDVFLIPINVDYVAESLKGEKRDSDGKPNFGNGDRELEQPDENSNEEAGVFVGHEQADVQKHRQKNGAPAPPGPGSPQAEEIIQRDGDQHDQDCHRFAEGIEYQACGCKDQIAGGVIANHSVKQERDRKEEKQKGQGTEGHIFSPMMWLDGGTESPEQKPVNAFQTYNLYLGSGNSASFIDRGTPSIGGSIRRPPTQPRNIAA